MKESRIGLSRALLVKMQNKGSDFQAENGYSKENTPQKGQLKRRRVRLHRNLADMGLENFAQKKRLGAPNSALSNLGGCREPAIEVQT